jgi:hypothetical protein
MGLSPVVPISRLAPASSPLSPKIHHRSSPLARAVAVCRRDSFGTAHVAIVSPGLSRPAFVCIVGDTHMHELKSRTVIVGLLLATVAAAPALAQDTRPVAVTPYVAIGSTGAAPVGAAIEFPLTPTFGVETDTGYRRGEGHINALSMNANLVCHLPRIGATTPYLAAGMGLAQYGAPIVSPLGGLPVGAEQRTALTVNAGGGLKVPVNDTWGLRTDARWFKSFGRHGSEQFRVAQGISFDVARR